MKIGILTSSRADYGIYKPLLQLLNSDDFFDLGIIAFGSHLYEKYGTTVNLIKEDGFRIDYEIKSMPKGDSPSDIASATGETVQKFSNVWQNSDYELVFALGDRFEMFAAVSAAVPFNKKTAHIHGGETTLGAIDNAFRHAISLMAHLHFAAAEPYKNRLSELLGTDQNIYNVGALSLDSIKQTPLLSMSDFKEKFKIDLGKPSILITFHPETVNFEKNKAYIEELIQALELISGYQFIITMPNADTMGLLIRRKLSDFAEKHPEAVVVESFGSQGYFTAMKHCVLMLGNTSSGFIEAAGFNKPVVNLGNRQKGRIITPNIVNAAIRKDDILKAVAKAEKYNGQDSVSIYGTGAAAQNIVRILKTYANKQL